MTFRPSVLGLLVCGTLGMPLAATTASAQSLGTFRWQLTPFCNVVSLGVTQNGGVFTLDGFDDQCGAATRAAVVGTAFPNPDSTIGLGLSIVATPGAAPVHVDVTLSLATIGGPWRDSAGNTGTFVFNPAVPAPGAPRPPTGGLISTVAPGEGLTGGGTTGAVSLAVAYGGSGSATTAARSDHTHGFATRNTAVGSDALTGNTSGTDSTAIGALALVSADFGEQNTGVGATALLTLFAGEMNTAVGSARNSSLIKGNRNTSLGGNALPLLSSGSDNLALGYRAGAVLSTGSNNIFIGSSAGSANESNVIRLGSPTHGATFVAGVYNSGVNAWNGQPVLADSGGKLGTVLSSARFKEDVRPLDDVSRALLRLEPVSFRYRADQQRGSAVQYGLIAEQVAQVMPELLIDDEEGRPLTVKYHVLPTLLVAEIQRLERERATLSKQLEEVRSRLDTLERERR